MTTSPTTSTTIAVTGAAGFIGSHLAGALVSHGRRVVGIDNFDPFYDRSLKEENVRGLAAGGGFTLAEGDICDFDWLSRLFERERPEGVVHLAAKAGVRPSVEDPVGYARANVLGTASVLEAAREAGVSRMVVASSSSVYGNNPKTPFAEEDSVDGPISPYAATKRACELQSFTHHHLTGMPTCCLRFFTVYGPRQRPDLAIGAFMRRLAAGETLSVYGDGSTSRDYTYIDDVVAGIISAYERVPRFGFRVWNLGSDRPVRLDELIAAIGRVVGVEPRVTHTPPLAGDVERTWADLSRARAELDYAPGTPLEEGLRRQWAWIAGEA